MTSMLEGKVAVVTGASKGLGAAIAKRLAAEGAAVVVNYSASRDSAQQVVADIVGSGGQAIAVQADVSKAEDIEHLFEQTRQAYGRLDILVNNAGVYEFMPLPAITESHFHRIFNINVLGLLLASQAALPLFGKSGGNIVNVSSLSSSYAAANAAVYSGTKGAVDAITRSLSAELAPLGIRVNAINPGLVETEGVHAVGAAEGDVRRRVEMLTPLGRIGQPEDVCGAVVFLASEQASWITGETLIIAGGMR